MSSANLELVRSMFAALESGDYSVAAWADPEIEYVFADGPSPGTFKGRAGLVQAMREVLSAWEAFHVNVDEYRELDDERVLVLLRVSGRGKTSGVELDQLSTQAANVVHVSDGKAIRIVAYFDRERAFADLRVSPDGDAP